jgi:hypothetical protein
VVVIGHLCCRSHAPREATQANPELRVRRDPLLHLPASVNHRCVILSKRSRNDWKRKRPTGDLAENEERLVTLARRK